MPKDTICPTCKGEGKYEVLINQNDDKTETVTCKTCDGKKVIHIMTDEEVQQEEKDGWIKYFIHLYKGSYIVFDDATNRHFEEFIKKFNKE